jgi:hypothetical protein
LTFYFIASVITYKFLFKREEFKIRRKLALMKNNEHFFKNFNEDFENN